MQIIAINRASWMVRLLSRLDAMPHSKYCFIFPTTNANATTEITEYNRDCLKCRHVIIVFKKTSYSERKLLICVDQQCLLI